MTRGAADATAPRACRPSTASFRFQTRERSKVHPDQKAPLARCVTCICIPESEIQANSASNLAATQNHSGGQAGLHSKRHTAVADITSPGYLSLGLAWLFVHRYRCGTCEVLHGCHIARRAPLTFWARSGLGPCLDLGQQTSEARNDNGGWCIRIRSASSSIQPACRSAGDHTCMRCAAALSALCRTCGRAARARAATHGSADEDTQLCWPKRPHFVGAIESACGSTASGAMPREPQPERREAAARSVAVCAPNQSRPPRAGLLTTLVRGDRVLLALRPHQWWPAPFGDARSSSRFPGTPDVAPQYCTSRRTSSCCDRSGIAPALHAMEQCDSRLDGPPSTHTITASAASRALEPTNTGLCGCARGMQILDRGPVPPLRVGAATGGLTFRPPPARLRHAPDSLACARRRAPVPAAPSVASEVYAGRAWWPWGPWMQLHAGPGV